MQMRSCLFVLAACVAATPVSAATPDGAPLCTVPAPIGVMDPQVACRFALAPPGDPEPDHLDAFAPLLVFPGGVRAGFPEPTPLLAGVFADIAPGSTTAFNGVLRLIDPLDCTQQALIVPTAIVAGGSDRMVAPFAPAVADLEGDGDYTIFVAQSNGNTAAYAGSGTVWKPLWADSWPPSFPWGQCQPGVTGCIGHVGGFALHDMDDDGNPELLRHGALFDARTGAVRSNAPSGYSLSSGTSPIAPTESLMDIDDDPMLEISDGQTLWEFASGTWAVDAGFAPTLAARGHVAFGDFGPYGSAGHAEVVRIRPGHYDLLDSTGALVESRALPGDPFAVSPTLADVDGDTMLETIVVTPGHVSLLDIDCGAAPRTGGTCTAGVCDFAGGACPPGFAWSRALAEGGLLTTAPIAFDFEHDGRAEVIHTDRCYTRAYDAHGRVLFSRAASGNPVGLQATVYGEGSAGAARLVVPANADSAPPTCAADVHGADPSFAGAACAIDSDCTTGVCDAGVCRCSAVAQCCDAGTDGECGAQGFVCVPPPSGTPGSGNSCRTTRVGSFQGLTVFTDARWSATRPIWNQAAFADTNVDDAGRVPRTSEWQRAPFFRSTSSRARLAADIALDAPRLGCVFGRARIEARVCNEGDAPIPAGTRVAAREGMVERCSVAIDRDLFPGECDPYACQWEDPPRDAPDAATLTLIGDPDDAVSECRDDNDATSLAGVFCATSTAVFRSGFESP